MSTDIPRWLLILVVVACILGLLAWARGQDLTVHAWIYGLRDGLLRDLDMTAGSAAGVQPAYQAAVEAMSAERAERHANGAEHRPNGHPTRSDHVE